MLGDAHYTAPLAKTNSFDGPWLKSFRLVLPFGSTWQFLHGHPDQLVYSFASTRNIVKSWRTLNGLQVFCGTWIALTTPSFWGSQTGRQLLSRFVRLAMPRMTRRTTWNAKNLDAVLHAPASCNSIKEESWDFPGKDPCAGRYGN